MKKKVLFALMLSCFVLSGCTLSTPLGTFSLGFDAESKTDEIVYTDEKGNSKSINLNDIKKNIDTLLESVELPEDASTEELKQFVDDCLKAVGIDKEALGGLTDEEISEVEEALKETLEENGVDTSDLDLELK